MEWIKVKRLYKNRVSTKVHMMGFEGPAPMTRANGDHAVRKGEITKPWMLEIPPAGICEIADTEYNRKKLKGQIANKLGPVFEVLDKDLDLNAPSAQMSEAEKLRKEIEELKKQKADLEKPDKKKVTRKPRKKKVAEPVKEESRQPMGVMEPDIEE